MAETTEIAWTDSTFNPLLGCTKVSPACKHCYAERDFDHRYKKVKWGDKGTRVITSEANWRKPIKWNRDCQSSKPFVQCVGCRNRGYVDEIGFCPVCGDPEGDEARPRVFCASLADIFEDWQGPILNHKGELLRESFDSRFEWTTVSINGGQNRLITMDDVRARLFRLIDTTPNLNWQLLTKRPENILKMWPEPMSGPSEGKYLRQNVWLGTSVENQEYANKRIVELLKCRELSPVLFLSCEPLLGKVDLTKVCRAYGEEHDYDWGYHIDNCLTGFRAHECGGAFTEKKIDWVIAGGESGPDMRPGQVEWFESLKDQCAAAGTPFFMKQMFGKTKQSMLPIPDHLMIREFPSP